MSTIWKNWAPQKCKFFSWLITQNRVWTADCLAKRGWPNCGNCPLCNQVPELAMHLLFQCRLSIRVWSMVRDWLQLEELYPNNWQGFEDVESWWY
uniref:Reverse transcriptase zinc-binding domain-containing protein n=1 Tax=Triticum urartu TaxID=4572 RepID=A0A8R7PVI3_TRIUA